MSFFEIFQKAVGGGFGCFPIALKQKNYQLDIKPIPSLGTSKFSTA
jgi:hypothetical protein